MDLNQLGKILFTQPPGSCGVCPIVNQEGYDNESCAEILLNLVNSGMQERSELFESLLSDSTLDYYNQRLQYVGYRMKVEAISHSELPQYIYFCSIRGRRFFMNRFHPFRLMEAMAMNRVPLSYNRLFRDPDYLHQVIMISRHTDGVIMYRFFPVNLIVNGQQINISRL